MSEEFKSELNDYDLWTHRSWDNSYYPDYSLDDIEENIESLWKTILAELSTEDETAISSPCKLQYRLRTEPTSDASTRPTGDSELVAQNTNTWISIISDGDNNILPCFPAKYECTIPSNTAAIRLVETGNKNEELIYKQTIPEKLFEERSNTIFEKIARNPIFKKLTEVRYPSKKSRRGEKR